MEIRTIQPFLHCFGSVREGTMCVARCIPPGLVWSQEGLGAATKGGETTFPPSRSTAA